MSGQIKKLSIFNNATISEKKDCCNPLFRRLHRDPGEIQKIEKFLKESGCTMTDAEFVYDSGWQSFIYCCYVFQDILAPHIQFEFHTKKSFQGSKELEEPMTFLHICEQFGQLLEHLYRTKGRPTLVDLSSRKIISGHSESYDSPNYPIISLLEYHISKILCSNFNLWGYRILARFPYLFKGSLAQFTGLLSRAKYEGLLSGLSQTSRDKSKQDFWFIYVYHSNFYLHLRNQLVLSYILPRYLQFSEFAQSPTYRRDYEKFSRVVKKMAQWKSERGFIVPFEFFEQTAMIRIIQHDAYYASGNTFEQPPLVDKFLSFLDSIYHLLLEKYSLKRLLSADKLSIGNDILADVMHLYPVPLELPPYWRSDFTQYWNEGK